MWLKYHKFFIGIAIVFFTFYVFSTPATAAVVFSDEFDGADLDSQWAVSLENATNWNYALNNSNLIVADITPETVDTGGGGEWSHPAARQFCIHLGRCAV